MLSARATRQVECGRAWHKIGRALMRIVREDAVCRRLMTLPSVIVRLVAITYRSAM